jgi:AbrB family transcriptional regulator (stage V sporulation protein T)
MRATGVVRRIDDLGRIVIPKEIRKTLRIKEGSPLEIFTEKDGDIILKKYSPINELSNFGEEYVESLAATTGFISIITDRDSVIAVAGTTKKEWLELRITDQIEKIITDRKEYIGFGEIEENKTMKASIKIVEDKEERKLTPQIIVPIISDSDTVGSVILISKDNTQISKVEEVVTKTAALFLGKQMEI